MVRTAMTSYYFRQSHMSDPLHVDIVVLGGARGKGISISLCIKIPLPHRRFNPKYHYIFFGSVTIMIKYTLETGYNVQFVPDFMCELT